ncbi:hypothetical protein ISF_01209 [Cordyceps fumosorosea ARSEF 2679]|uniref:DUF8035 domain-containing protein n=1 Tax=Cordyceps fumosorosea (strain ARSEF 2679) TaxID=1081104 RepID=A0A168D3S4_CORFA|nr:hypothetical protein ISF_01209 [Cordyceps fumosorosea ARSEF 2679]OAA72136.1 hypothetical protein ISF_01209 [Cordyceps fumosorosea ARSEF 2679]
MADRHRNYHHLSRPASTNPSRSSVPAGVVYQTSYADDSYLNAASSRHPATSPRGHSSSAASSGQPATIRTYAFPQNPRSHLATRDHIHTRRSTMDSVTRPPMIITTRQVDRPHNSPVHSTGARNSSPVRDDYRHANSQYYAVPASTSRSCSAARPYYVEGHTHRRGRGDSLLSPNDAESYCLPRPSAPYSSNARHSAASIDYGDDGYKYTNAGELVRYDLDHPKPSRSQRYDSFERGYYRPRASYAMDPRSDGARHEIDRAYAVPHGRPDARSGLPPSTRRFDKTHRDYTLDPDHQAPPAAPKPPRPLPYSETSGNLRDTGVRHRRPVSISQEPSYWDNSYTSREALRDPPSHARDNSDDRGVEKRRPHSTHFYDDSDPSRGFGVRTSPDAAPDNRPNSRRDGQRDRDEPRRSDHVRSGEKPLFEPRKSTQDRPTLFTSESKHLEGNRKDNSRETSHRVLETAGTGLGITAATAALSASRRDNEPEPVSGLGEQRDAGPSSATRDSIRRETSDAARTSSPKGSAEATRDRYSPRPEAARINEDSGGLSDNGGASLVKYSTPSVSDSDDAGRGRVGRDSRPSNSFNPRDADDLRRVKEQLAALRMQDSQQQGNATPCGENERSARSPSPRKEAPGVPAPDNANQNYAVGFPADKKHARVVSPPRDKREDKPLRGILKQPSASFPEEANPVREGVAPHKEDKKLKEVPPGARWTKINRKVVNPEALTIGQERFEERDDFVIVLRVLSKEEIQAYAAATQVLRERRRTRDRPDREQERRHRQDDDSSRHHRSHRPHGWGDGYNNSNDGKTRAIDGNVDANGGQLSASDDGTDGPSGGLVGVDGEGGRARRSRQEDEDSDTAARRRDRARDDNADGDSERRRRPARDDDNGREQHRGDGDRYRR